jgi:Sulfotransferase domain
MSAAALRSSRTADPPVTWLASYPRSGNTLLRMILKQCFGLSSQSVYTDADFADPLVADAVGHEAVGDDPFAFVARARKEGRWLYVKTHEMPQRQHRPVIYVVRDGRAAVVSYLHYLRQVLGHEVDLANVIDGRMGPLWSDHVRAWALEPRANRLVVRYERLAAADEETLKAIAGFIGAPQRKSHDLSFARLNAMNPVFFRRGSDAANIAEMDQEAQALFERLHGQTLREIGYA